MSSDQGAGGSDAAPEPTVLEAAGGDRDDAALLAAHVAGDPDAFGELVRRHRDRLWALSLIHI